MARLSSFARKTLAILKKIPPGKVITYAGLARAVGHPKAYRAVGSVLNKNPFSPVVPCHRVIKSNGQIGGYNKGMDKKINLLKKEGIKIKNKHVENLELVLYKFKKQPRPAKCGAELFY
jgi:methylated-DNA-[protein]-cysteine S-methyltransferase